MAVVDDPLAEVNVAEWLRGKATAYRRAGTTYARANRKDDAAIAIAIAHALDDLAFDVDVAIASGLVRG